MEAKAKEKATFADAFQQGGDGEAAHNYRVSRDYAISTADYDRRQIADLEAKAQKNLKVDCFALCTGEAHYGDPVYDVGSVR